MPSWRVTVAIPVLLCVAPWAGICAAADPARAADAAALTPGAIDAQVTFPRILTPADVERYRGIFAAQEDGDWQTADRLIAGLADRVLMGHVLAQRYLHPTAYRSQYKELKDWMAAYADHPDARRIYKLARSRQPQGWRPPNPPVEAQASAQPPETIGTVIPSRRLGRAERQRVRELQYQVRRYLKAGYTLTTKKLLDTDEVKRLFSV